MGADKLYVTIEPAPRTDPERLLEDLPTGDFFRWARVEAGQIRCCRYSHDRDIVRRMVEPERDRVRRIAMIEVADTAAIGTAYRYERVDGEFVVVDRTTGGEHYGDDVANYLHWSCGFDAGV